MEDQDFGKTFALKMRVLVLSSDSEMINHIEKTFEELGVEVFNFFPTIKLAREKLILNADNLIPYNFILITNTNDQFSEEGLTEAIDIIGKVRLDKLYLNTPILMIKNNIGTDELTDTDPEIKYLDPQTFQASLAKEFKTFVKNSYPEGPHSLKTAFKKGIHYIYIPSEMDKVLFNELKDLSDSIIKNNVIIQILDFQKSNENMSDKEVQMLMEYCRDSEKKSLPVCSLNIPNSLMTVLHDKRIDKTFNPKKDLQDALKTINIDVKKKSKSPQPSRGGGGGAGMKMNVNVINPFLAACSELFKETEGKNVIVERPRLCIKFDDPSVQLASLIRFFDSKFKGGVLFAYSDKSIQKFKEKNPGVNPTRELSLHIEKIIDKAKLKSKEEDTIYPSSIEILQTKADISTAVGKQGSIRIRFASKENWLDAYIIK
jgi:hypothetical protein